MELIDRYIYAVSVRLPESYRSEVIQELRTNIEDMLPEDATGNDIRDVLKKLGNPAKLADEYSQVKRYLIGPGLYDRYFSVLKLVTGIVAIVLFLVTLVDGILTAPIPHGILGLGITLFVDILIAVSTGIMQAFLWVTLVFVIIERVNADQELPPFSKKEWSPDDLAPIPLGKSKISRGEAIFSLFGTIFFTALLYFAPHLIGVYVKNGSTINLIELFVVERLQYYILFIILLAIFNIGIIIFKLIVGHWNFSIAITNAVHNLLLSVLVCVMISDAALFNPEFFVYFSNLFAISMAQVMPIWSRILAVFAVSFVAINIWDSVAGFNKYKK